MGFTSPTICDVCKKATKPAKSSCRVCEEFLCFDCETAHKGSKATKDHQLVSFVEMCEEIQRDIKRQIQRLQDTKTDVRKNASSNRHLLKQIVESEDAVIGEINKYRYSIIQRVDQHHHQLLEEVRSVTQHLQDTLRETAKLFEQCENEIEDEVNFLSQVSGSKDYSLMTDTLSNLSTEIERDLQLIQSHLPKIDPKSLSTISASLTQRCKSWHLSKG